MIGQGQSASCLSSKVTSPFPADSQPEQLFAAWTLKLAGGRQLPQGPQPIVPVRSDAGEARSRSAVWSATNIHRLGFQLRYSNRFHSSSLPTVLPSRYLRLSYEIHRDNGLFAVVMKELFTFFNCRFTADVPGPDDLEANEDFTHHDIPIWRQSGLRATVPKQWFAWSDTCRVDTRHSLIDPAWRYSRTGLFKSNRSRMNKGAEWVWRERCRREWWAHTASVGR